MTKSRNVGIGGPGGLGTAGRRGRWRAAVVGCGDVSVNHFDAIADNSDIELVAVADTDPARRRMASAANGVPGFATVDDLLDAVPVDVVHVCTPHDQHVPVSLSALRRGVNVLQEKPLATTMADGRELAESVEAGTAKFAVCYQNRYNEASRRAHDLIQSGALGEIRGGYGSCVWTRTVDYYRARPWRASWRQAGGGVLINQSIHTLDLLQWLLGGVTDVHGWAGQLKFAGITEVEDTAAARFNHPGGQTSTFFATLADEVGRPAEVEIVGSRGSVLIRDGLQVQLADRQATFFPEPHASGRGRSYWGYSHARLIADFYAKLLDPEPFWIGAREALTSLWMVKRIQEQSSGLGGPATWRGSRH